MTELITSYPNRPKTHDFVLDAPFNSQVDNSPNKGQGEGWRQCNLTCAAMLAKYLNPSLWPGYKDIANGMQDALAPYGDTTDHDAITKALRSLGIESYFSYSASLDDCSHSLYMGVPVLAGTAYKTGGHMILFVGRNEKGFMAHNPYGFRDGTSDQWIEVGGLAGKDEALSFNWLNHCFVDQGPKSGWARFVTAVDGVPTEIKKEM
jgi:hypothetical protein